MNSTHEIQGQADLPDPLLRVCILSSKACTISGVVHIVYVFSSDLLRVCLWMIRLTCVQLDPCGLLVSL